MARSFTFASTQKLSASGAAPVTTYPFTIMGWVRPSATSTWPIITLCTTNKTDARFTVNCNGDAFLLVAISLIEGAKSCTTSTTYTANTWNHFAAVFTSRTSMAIYMNGAGSASSAVDVNPLLIADLHIGHSTGGNYFDGRIAELAIWNAALNIDAITAGSNRVSPLQIQRQSLVSYYPLYGFQDPEQDLVRAGALTLQNSPPSAEHAPVAMIYDPAASTVLSAVAVPSGKYRGFLALG